MELFLKIAATSLVLLVLSPQPVHLQDIAGTTDTPRRSISPSWLRGKRPLRPLKIVLREVEETPSADQGADESGVGSGMDSKGEMVSSSVVIAVEDNADKTTAYTTEPSIILNPTTLAQEVQDNNDATTTQIPNVHEDDSGDNATFWGNTEETLENSTNSSDVSEGETTTAAPENDVTEAAESGSGEGVANDTESDPNTTAAVPAPDATTKEATEEAETTASSGTTAAAPAPDATTKEATEEAETTVSSGNIPPEATTTSEVTTSTPITADQGNLSDKGADPSDDTAERGFASESERRQRKSAWGAVLGTFVAVAVVGLVAYIILKKKHHKAFSHRKLQEDFPSDPVLRLDNSEPLDLNFGRAAYYNPGLQGDNIQMSPFPRT